MVFHIAQLPHRTGGEPDRIARRRLVHVCVVPCTFSPRHCTWRKMSSRYRQERMVDAHLLRPSHRCHLAHHPFHKGGRSWSQCLRRRSEGLLILETVSQSFSTSTTRGPKRSVRVSYHNAISIRPSAFLLPTGVQYIVLPLRSI